MNKFYNTSDCARNSKSSMWIYVRTRILITNEKMTGLIFFLVLISAVDMRHEFERPSRIVAIKQGRIQGKVRDLPLQGVSSSGDDIDDTYRYDIKIKMIYHSHLWCIYIYISFRVKVLLLYSRQVEVFRGIPFAAPPIQSLRFMPPVTATKWRNVKQAVEFGPVCPQQPPQIRNESAALQNMGKGRLRALKQIVPQLKNQSEDCLYLNVYAPLSGKNHIS